jgi:N-acyl-D-amino-acid deacylase
MMTTHYDVLIRNATIVDGTRAPRFDGDIAIRADRIVRVGDLPDATADLVIDATGLVAAPGFIDAHTHDDRLMLSDGDMTPKVSQGITTIVGGNCGISLAPMPRPIPNPVTPPLSLLDNQGGWFRFARFADYVQALEAQPAATNCAMLVGHATLRVATMDDLSRPATPAEIAAMQALVTEALDAGAIGVSTGLSYAPARAATTEEVIAVCAPLAARGALYCTHMRDESDHVVPALDEAFRIGREANVPVVISHHKVTGTPNYGRSAETLALIERHMKTQPICLDCYPYNASSTVLTADLIASSARITVTWSTTLPQYAGRDLADVAAELDVSQEEAVEKLLPAGAIYHRIDDADVQRILKFDETMIGSDGLPHDEKPHPRLWGTFPRVLGHYGRALGLFPLETAVYKMTGLTAKNFGLADRGVIREGAFADITLFDAETVDEGATFARPAVPSVGIETVLVNGQVVWRDGQVSGNRPGRVLRREASPSA